MTTNMHDYSRPDVSAMNLGSPTNRKTPEQQTAEKAERKPFTNYVPIKGRPGWEDDGFGHQRYDATRDAIAHEKVENKREAGIALAVLEQTPLATLQAFNDEQDAHDFGPCATEFGTAVAEACRREYENTNESWNTGNHDHSADAFAYLAQAVARDRATTAQYRQQVVSGACCAGKSTLALDMRRFWQGLQPHETPASTGPMVWVDELAKANRMPAPNPGLLGYKSVVVDEMAKVNHAQPPDPASDVRCAITHLASLHPVPAGCALTESRHGGLRAQVLLLSHAQRAQATEWLAWLSENKPANLRLTVDYEQTPRLQSLMQGLVGYKSVVLPSQGLVRHEFRFVGDDSFSAATIPIPGCTVTLHQGDARGDGPLVTWDEGYFHSIDGASTPGALRGYLVGLQATMKPHDVPVYVRRGEHGTINVWNRRE